MSFFQLFRAFVFACFRVMNQEFVFWLHAVIILSMLYIFLFVRSSVVPFRGVYLMGWRSAMLHVNLRGDKNPGSTNKYTKFGQITTGKVIKIITTRCYFLRLKWFEPNSIPGVCPFVRWFVCPFVS